MTDLTPREELTALLAKCELLQDKFTANEFNVYAEIKQKSLDALDFSFDDKVCLEVMLRNIAIRGNPGD